MAMTVYEVSTMDIPQSRQAGTGRGRVLLAVKGTANYGDTLAVSTYVPDVDEVEGQLWNTVLNATSRTAIVWGPGTTTVTNNGANTTTVGSVDFGIVLSIK